MDALEKEINELKQFMVDLKADRAATKAKEKAEAWTKYVALTLVIIAVIAAVANQYSGKYSSQVQINQIKASDSWNWYEAKSIKQHVDVSALTQLQLDNNPTNPAVKQAILKIQAEIAQLKLDKTNSQNDALDFQNKRDEAAVRGRHMGLSVTMFSVAIATASICTVTKKKPLWFAAMAMAAFAIFKMVLAWTV